MNEEHMNYGEQNQQYGQQYDQSYGQTYGQQYDQSYGQTYDRQYNQMYDHPVKLSMTSQEAEESSNLIPGIVGAFLGSLVGVAMWVLIYHLGYIAGIAGAIMVVCALFGYEKLGKKLDLKGIIISVVISIIMVYIAERVSISMEMFLELKDYLGGTFFDYYRGMYDILEKTETTSSFWGELGIGYFLFAIASASYIFKVFKTGKRK